ncbi:SDR family oxidoreductase [Massilia sp. DWR3-1-1]|uniref:SDR family oxidoreductase n=1 Tax=Massilia sp. DWR3-1-1 TaxID=2804559 RepID=UPI003CEF08FB
MHISDNTILITGGGSGIGRALAEAFQRAGNDVIIAGRRQDALDTVLAANPGMHAAVLDIEDGASIAPFAAALLARFPRLNVVIHNAGIMRPEKLIEGGLDTAEHTIATNLLGPIRLNDALLPQLLAQPRATVITVSSGLAFLPLAATPTYSATKAAIHAYTMALRHQLKSTSVEVLELAPPYVQTELMGEQQASDPRAMPLADFISEVMALIAHGPEHGEILVERVKPLRNAEASGNYHGFFTTFNEAMAH